MTLHQSHQSTLQLHLLSFVTGQTYIHGLFTHYWTLSAGETVRNFTSNIYANEKLTILRFLKCQMMDYKMKNLNELKD